MEEFEPLYLTKETPIPSADKCLSILKRHNSMMGICLDYDRMLEYYAYYKLEALEAAKELTRIIADPAKGLLTPGLSRAWTDINTGALKPRALTGDMMLKWLEEKHATQGLLYTDEGAVSLGADSIEAAIATGLYQKEITDVMLLYAKASSLSYKVSSFKKIIISNEPVNVLSYDNHRMVVLRDINWSIQNTGRLGMGLMNIAKELHDIETVPKGWVYVTVDSGQIEPRIIQSAFIRDPQILFCTRMYNDAYYGYVHYCKFLSDEERRSKSLELKPVEITDELKELRSKFKTYGNAVVYGSTENSRNDRDKDLFIKYIGHHPERIEWQKRVEEQVLKEDWVFRTYFGTPINIMNGPSASKDRKYDEKTRFKRRVKRGINNPIQGTAADLMRYSINAADKLLMRKALNSVILKYTHDSGTFAVYEDEYHAVEKQLRGITSYRVEGWVDINGDYECGVTCKSDFPRVI